MLERFSPKARKALEQAHEEACSYGHEFIGTEHLLLGLVKQRSCVAASVCESLGGDSARIRIEVEKLIVPAKDSPMRAHTGLPYTPRAKNALKKAKEEADSLRHRYIGTEHLLLGCLWDGDCVASVALANLGITHKAAKEKVRDLLGTKEDD